MDELGHQPVLLDEVLAALNVRHDGIYVDATAGRGGHAQAIVRCLGSRGRLLALDRDPEAVAAVRRRFAADARIEVHQAAFSRLGRCLEERGWVGRVNGLLFDLGVSSPQLEDPRRGFGFRADGPLDMRMDPGAGSSAAQWIAGAAETEIADVIHRYGEERFARRIARAIVRRRAQAPLDTTHALAETVARAVPTRQRGRDPATRTFQAVRIHINRELEELEQVLPQAVQALAVGGRLAVISFHSLEDRLVKRFLRAEAKGPTPSEDLPWPAPEFRPRVRLLGRLQRPGPEERVRNPRARSAVLRAAERTEVPYG